MPQPQAVVEPQKALDRSADDAQVLARIERIMRAEQRSRVARAERAHDQMVHLLGVLQRDDDRGRSRVEVEFERGLACVRKQAPLEVLVDPCARDEARPVGRCTRDELVDPVTNVVRLCHAKEYATLDAALERLARKP